MTDQAPPQGGENITPVPMTEALSQRYLAYAMSTIMSRSLPDVRDGLKPVHRRLLYAMRLLRLDPEAGFKKCARIVGDVMGKFHPHGDQAIYDALVRLAQDFAVRYPLVEGQGNFGNIDGDNAAAMRYTEARLTAIAERLLRDIDNDTVDFQATYDGEDSEPLVLPAAFPNLLANGAAGIAVGMATNIPPHNAVELCEALIHLIKKPDASVADLMKFIPGPDMPTGGVLVEDADKIRETYETGRGSLRIRYRWVKEDGARGAYTIVVTQLPYQVQKSRLIEKMADMIHDKKLPALADIRDESADDVRLVLEPRNRTIDPEQLMEQLFKLTDLETRFGVNMNVLDANRTPRVMPLNEMLQAYLDHRHVVLVRGTRHRLAKIADRLEVLGGFLVAYLNLDEVIHIIRNEDKPRPVLMARFELTERQAEAILNMRLRQLRKLEEMEIRNEHDALTAEQADLQDLLADEGRRWRVISDETVELRDWLQDRPELADRRTRIDGPPSAEPLAVDVMVEREPITVICSKMGWIRAAKGHIPLDSELKFKDGDSAQFVLHAQTTDRLLLLSSDGRIFTLGGDKLPGGRGHGEPVRLMVDLANDQEIVDIVTHVPGRKRIIASSAGRGFVVAEDGVIAQTRSGKQVLNLGLDEGVFTFVVAEGDSVAVVGENRKLLVFGLDELPEMGRGKGVLLQRYKDGGISDIKTFTRADGLSWQTQSGRNHVAEDLTLWTGKRASAGKLAPRGFNRTNKFT